MAQDIVANAVFCEEEVARLHPHFPQTLKQVFKRIKRSQISFKNSVVENLTSTQNNHKVIPKFIPRK